MQQHAVDDTTSIKFDQSKARPPNTPGAREAEDDIYSSSRPPHRRTILKVWENKCIVTTKQYRGVHRDTLHQPQNTNSLRDTEDNTTNIVFIYMKTMSLLSNFTPRMSRFGLAQMETTDMTKSPWGGLTVRDLLTTKALVLLGLSIMHQ